MATSSRGFLGPLAHKCQEGKLLHSNRQIKGRGQGLGVKFIEVTVGQPEGELVLSNYVTGKGILEALWGNQKTQLALSWSGKLATKRPRGQGQSEGGGGLSGSHVCFVDIWEVF